MIDTARDAASKRVFDSIKTKLFGLGIAGLLGIGAVATAPAAHAAGGTAPPGTHGARCDIASASRASA